MRHILKVISALGITRLIIAHRPETIRTADRVVALVDGQVVEVGGECGPATETERTTF